MLEKKTLVSMYTVQKLSMQDIALKMHCSLNQIHYWLKKYKIKSRTRSEALYQKNNPDGDPFKLKASFDKEDMFLLGLGLGLWWGEGSKLHRGTIRLGNTDPRLIKRFIDFLTVICGVKKDKMRFGLQVFSDVNPQAAKDFWVKALGISEDRFFPKIVVTPSGKIGTYKKKSENGVLILYCANVKLRKVLDELMEKYALIG